MMSKITDLDLEVAGKYGVPYLCGLFIHSATWHCHLQPVEVRLNRLDMIYILVSKE